MKKLIIIVLFFPVFLSGQIKFPTYIDRNSPTDETTTHIDTMGMGGYISIYDTSNIFAAQRVVGMLIYQRKDSLRYEWNGQNWDAVSFGGGSADGVVTSGAFDNINDEIDFTVQAPGANFSVGLSDKLNVGDTTGMLSTYVSNSDLTAELSSYAEIAGNNTFTGTNTFVNNIAGKSAVLTATGPTVDILSLYGNNATRSILLATVDNDGYIIGGNSEGQNKFFFHADGVSYFNGGFVAFGKTTAATAVDVNGVITATGGDSDDWNTVTLKLNKSDTAAMLSYFEDHTELDTRSTNDRSRANHTGTQLANTISDFQDAVDINTKLDTVYTALVNRTYYDQRIKVLHADSTTYTIQQEDIYSRIIPVNADTVWITIPEDLFTAGQTYSAYFQVERLAGVGVVVIQGVNSSISINNTISTKEYISNIYGLRRFYKEANNKFYFQQ